MAHVVIAVAVGLLAGTATGGRPGRGPAVRVRWWPVLVAAVGLQVVAGLVDGDQEVAFALVLASYAGLVAFAGANLRLLGLPVLLVGLTLNLTIMVVNDGMPVRPSALVRAGLVDPSELASVELGAKRHLETDADRLGWLGDILPVAALRQVLSPGDVVVAVGLALATCGLVPPRRTGSPARRAPQGRAADRAGGSR